MIRLGNCFDLLDPDNVKELESLHQGYLETEEIADRIPKENANTHKYLDCAVFQHAYAAFEEKNIPVDTARAVYVPTSSSDRVWIRSWISRQAHIQICVRSQACILGTWLVKPIGEDQDG